MELPIETKRELLKSEIKSFQEALYVQRVRAKMWTDAGNVQQAEASVKTASDIQLAINSLIKQQEELA